VRARRDKTTCRRTSRVAGGLVAVDGATNLARWRRRQLAATRPVTQRGEHERRLSHVSHHVSR